MCMRLTPACCAQTLSILNPEELRLPPVKVPDGLDAPAHAAYTRLAELVQLCTATAASKRPAFGCAAVWPGPRCCRGSIVYSHR